VKKEKLPYKLCMICGSFYYRWYKY